MVIAPDPVGGAAAQRLAEAELRRHEYHREPSLLSRFTSWVGDKLGSLFSGTAGAGSHAILLLLVIIAVVAIVLAVRAGVPARRAGGRIADDGDPLAPIAARDHRRLALQFTAEGRRAEALREWLRAAVQTIEERGVLPPRPGRTGAATAREAGPALPAVAQDLAAAMIAFDEVWFGGRTPRDDDVERARSAAEGVASARVASQADTAGTPPGLAVPW